MGAQVARPTPRSERHAGQLARPGRDSIIRCRPRAGRAHRILLSLAFALVGTPILMSSRWLVESVDFRTGATAPVTVRVPLFLGHTADDIELRRGGIVAARGETIEDAARIQRVREQQLTGWSAWMSYLVALFLIGVLYTDQLKRSRKGRLLRIQAALLGLQLGVAAMAAIALPMTPISAVVLPSAILVIATAVTIDLGTALATAIVAALLLGGLTPFDPGVIAVLAVQGVCAALLVGDRPRRRFGKARILAAGAVGGGAAALAYFMIFYLSWNRSPMAELGAPLQSAWLWAGAGVGGLLAAVIAIPCLHPFQHLMGDIPLATLIELEDLSHPLLKQIAESSPGTWQHSLAMANMAQIAANAIGADGRLVRVGAYYHDLGKSLQPKYFIENLSGGEPSPHDALPPTVSCHAIFAHVTEGVRMARRHGLHERIIDFMHMHHGDGLLEYFWVKCQEQGNPDRLSEADFRYPGVKPDSRETAILAICDAVEAASRTLRNPDSQAIEALVQHIVYGKLYLGQLDESGLTIADLRVISSSLMDTIKHAHHGRIEYQWQRPKRPDGAAEAASAESTEPTRDGRSRMRAQSPLLAVPLADAEEDEADSPTRRLLREPRLDSLDAPRPAWRRRGAARGTGSLETATTEPIASDGDATWGLTRPPTAVEVARTTADMIPSLDPALAPSASPDPTPLADTAALRAAKPSPNAPARPSSGSTERPGPTLGKGTGSNEAQGREESGGGDTSSGSEPVLPPVEPGDPDQRS